MNDYTRILLYLYHHLYNCSATVFDFVAVVCVFFKLALAERKQQNKYDRKNDGRRFGFDLIFVKLKSKGGFISKFLHQHLVKCYHAVDVFLVHDFIRGMHIIFRGTYKAPVPGVVAALQFLCIASARPFYL